MTRLKIEAVSHSVEVEITADGQVVQRIVAPACSQEMICYMRSGITITVRELPDEAPTQR